MVNKTALGRVVRIVVYLNAFALVAGIALCYYLGSNLIPKGILEYLGDVVLLEVMLLFLAGGFAGITSSKSWSETMRVLAFWRRQAGAPLPEDTEWSSERQRMAEANGVVYIAAGVLMVIELVVLGLAWG